MPSKKGSKKGKIDKDLNRAASQFRSLLATAREEYAKGRSIDAADIQKEALEFGSKNLPRFDDNSLVKAHALLELGLATSAITTDFAQGEEWSLKCNEMHEVLDEALQIYHYRLSNGTLTKWRKEEVWLKGKNYESPVPHTERLGPIDFITCTNMACGFHATPESVASLKKALSFVRQFKANKCVIQMENGGALQGQLPGDVVLENIRKSLRRHEQELAGIAVDSSTEPDVREEMRHTGTRLGKMKLSHEKLAKDIEKKGLKRCGYADCNMMERQPREFATCSKCKWTAYCCKDHQIADWKIRHKKECKTVAVEQRREYKETRKAEHTLNPGQAQNFMTIVLHMHHFFIQSPEVKPLLTLTNPAIISKVESVEDHQKLSMGEINIIWNCFWSIPESKRLSLLQSFVDEMESYGFPSVAMGGPDFSVVLDWNEHAVNGLFAVVKHTRKGSILLHDDGSNVKAYQVGGITNNVESMLGSQPLPVYIGTALLPFKGLIVTQGTMIAGFDASSRLREAAVAFIASENEKSPTIITDLLK